ncbi:hypothetical protein CQW23_17024 [Capsicum baccatum]|uniref:Aminotransferase class I/classII domain-containing protein n=1 Tax=Capsicum baccatum TaxID=33114 RepID=A0A2G2WCV3_CAPBA|nr:hypothetical protein CQW23_17024 [Capsicum baccatum]
MQIVTLGSISKIWIFPGWRLGWLVTNDPNGMLKEHRILGDILIGRSNSIVMTHYVISRDNLRILMNLLKESSKSIQIEAFHVFKLFVANKNKPSDIVNILIANRSKLLHLFANFKTKKDILSVATTFTSGNGVYSLRHVS